MPPDFVGGYELGAAKLIDHLRDERGWKIETLCSHRRTNLTPERAEPSLLAYHPLGWKNHAILPGLLNRARREWPQRLQRIQQEAPQCPTILFNPRRLWIPEWMAWLEHSPAASTYISDLWPNEYPACDLFRENLLYNRERLPIWMKPFLGKWRRAYKNTWPGPHPSLAPLKGAIYVSEFIRRRTREAFPDLRAEAVIPWGIEPDQFPVPQGERPPVTEWGFIGRLHEEKGPHTLLEAIPVLVAEGHDIRLKIAGDPDTRYGRELQQTVEGNPVLRDRVSFLGKVSRDRVVPDFFHQIGTLLFPSLWEEPFAITVLEALATGLPVIATDRGGTAEIINRETGYLYHPGETRGLLEAARALLADPGEARSRGERGSVVIRENYTMTQMAEKVDAFLKLRINN